jgi:predicted RNase H-like HicB family nuclease
MGEAYHVRIEKDPGSKWLVVQCIEHPEAMSQGKTVDECIKNISEALDLVLEEKARFAS